MSPSAAAVIATILLLFFGSVHSTYNEKPNFVILFADDLGFNDVDWRGTTNIYTPNLSSLKKNNAIELNRFYVTPKCSPTRSSLFTGRYTYKIGMQHDVGIIEFFTCGLEPSLGNTFWTTRLKTCSGYNNYYLGKWHLGEYYWSTTPIFRGGFDYFKGYLNSQINYFNFTYHPNLDKLNISKTYHGGFYDYRENTDLALPTKDNYTTTAFGEGALDIIRTIGDTNDDTPFSLIVSFEAPHGPVHYPPGFFWDDILQGNGNTGPGGPYGDPDNENYETRRQYVSMVYAMDYYIGEIVDALKDNTVNGVRIWDNTWFFFFSDNGGIITYASNYPLRGAKSTNFEGGIRVPALISGGLLPVRLKGKEYDGLVHITDIYATIMDLTNTSSDDLFLDGETLRPLLESPGNDIVHTRQSFIITADEVECNATYNDEYLCGGIIRDFDKDNSDRTEGIWKLVIGSAALDGTGKKFGWGELDNMQGILNYHSNLGTEPQFNCDPYNKNYTIPEYGTDFKLTDCANNQLPCLYRLDEDPCETHNYAEDPQYNQIFNILINELQEAYDDQARPFWTNIECAGADPEEVFDYMYDRGYYAPFAPHFTGDDQYKKENTPIYRGVCSPTSSPTVDPTIFPTEEPTTAEPTAPTMEPTTAMPTQDPTTVPFCCSNIAWQTKWKNKCATFGAKPACERLTGAAGNNRCKWMACSLVGECNWIRTSSAGSQKVCKKLTSQDDCEAKAFCEWEFTNSYQMDDIINDDIQFVNDFVDNVDIGEEEGIFKGEFRWYYVFILSFILLCAAIIVYWNKNNISGKRKDKYIGTEYESLLKVETH